jgi:hypothetical protein
LRRTRGRPGADWHPIASAPPLMMKLSVNSEDESSGSCVLSKQENTIISKPKSPTECSSLQIDEHACFLKRGLSASRWPHSNKPILGFCAPPESTRIDFIRRCIPKKPILHLHKWLSKPWQVRSLALNRPRYCETDVYCAAEPVIPTPRWFLQAGGSFFLRSLFGRSERDNLG